MTRHMSPNICPPLPCWSLCCTCFKCPRGCWCDSSAQKWKKKKTWHAFRAQLPNASHYYCGSSTINPWGKGPQSLHSTSLPPWAMDLWYPRSPYGPIGHIYINNHTHPENISLHCSHMLISLPDSFNQLCPKACTRFPICGHEPSFYTSACEDWNWRREKNNLLKDRIFIVTLAHVSGWDLKSTVSHRWHGNCYVTYIPY